MQDMVFPCHDLEQSNSQDSSLNDSTASQCAPPGSAQTTEASQRNASWGAVTPSTSLSNYSRQEHPIATRQNDAISSMVDDEGILARKQSPFTGAHDRNQPKYQPLELHNDRNLAPKRMANGEIKFTGYSLPASPIESSPYGLSRNSSRTSRGSQIGEISDQLRTRLSYAMVKVQNGWQSHNINDLETMASHQFTPVTASAERRRPYSSPNASDRPLDRAHFMQPFEPAPAIKSHVHASPQKTTDPSVYGYSLPGNGLPKHVRHSTQVGASYESFWRAHEGTNVSRSSQTRPPSTDGPSLAPPADIVSRTPRRADSMKRQPPPLQTNVMESPYGHSHPASFFDAPSTPPQKRGAKIRTPSQQAAVEKDAVETLLFMSSPGISGYQQSNAFPGTQLRSQSSPSNVQVDLSAAVQDSDQRRSNRGPETLPGQSTNSKRQLLDANIDRTLDEMPDTSSSEDDDLLNRGPTPWIPGR